MERSIALFCFFITAILFVSCSSSTTESISTNDIPVTNKNGERPEKFKPTKNMISIDPIRGEYTVKVGQQVYYAANVHGSVGYTAEARSSAAGLDLNNSFIEYKQKQQPGMTGGDAATRYFIFDAVKSGSYEVIVQKYFRGSLETEHTIQVTVIE
jgi:hypothetical protein